MLIDLKERLDDAEVKEVLEYCVYPDPEKLEAAIEAYKADPGLELYGHEEEGELIGVAGFRMDSEGQLNIEHIAVAPNHRGLGYGRGLILETIEIKSPAIIVAETDEESVNFYRSIGFEIESLGEIYPGVERFKCIYTVEPEE
ncbi:GNAT family N-acetyltransferase [Cohnella terricola]|uniref:GNAT family N-acetyltransferase n=1 Tax=Cohnella terricola TaxID=1289167 RepID=A0A559J614_9BACL|nr:GNAT family N-acetyltransferase [Cohnella terricola]TVX95325.1 GNAT family N-acetyltransferase [Cohnella terricola]